MSCTKPQITQPNLHQIQLSGTVLESSGRADSETAIGFHIWPRFEGVIEVSLADNWKDHCCICQVCYRRFSQKGNLYHEDALHKDDKFEYKDCSKQSRHKLSLIKHINTVHKGIKYKCKECGKEFARLEKKKIHIKSIYEKVKYPFTLCSYQATSRKDL